MSQSLSEIQEYFDAQANHRARWKKKNWYYHKKVTEYFKFIIPQGYRVLEIGSGDGELLEALKPSRGLGMDASPVFVEQAAKKYPHLEFRHAFAERFETNEKFDYVILSHLVGYLGDVEQVLENLHQVCIPSTRIVINYYNYLWEPLSGFGDLLGLRMKQRVQNWLSLEDLENLLHLAGFETVTKTGKLLLPVYIPLFSGVINRIFANLPFLRKLCLAEFIVARPRPVEDNSRRSVSIVVPCKNEKGNIEELIKRVPPLSDVMEMIFVDGRSMDGTCEEVQRMIALYPEKNISLLIQEGPPGKGGAVRLGFEKAKGEVLIILDADISVAPEDTQKFYRLLVSGTGELINGTRMVYPMEQQAMRFLNVLGNKFFSMMFSFLLDQRIKDTLCGTKALFKRDYDKIARNRSFFGEFDPFGDFDLLFGAAKLNLKILEVPVRYYERHYGITKIKRFRHGLLLLGMCLTAMRKLKFT